MTTPICDFVRRYAQSTAIRLHMPGHKGESILGIEHLDLTEIEGADVLYDAHGIILESEQNASNLFGTAKTLYSTEGSSLSIRAMLYLISLYASSRGLRPYVWAGRNAHKSFMNAVALLDIDVEWLYGDSHTLLCCHIAPEELDSRLSAAKLKPTALYLTSPDYLGNMEDIAALSAVCHRHDVLLLVDNAHGAYLRFLEEDIHPITLGADACCDSAHKTLPVLTGGGYLHIAKTAPALFADMAESAMALFASTSPSYLILQSLDAANTSLASTFPASLASTANMVATLKQNLHALGYTMCGTEPTKLTIAPKAFGYTGAELSAYLASENIICEFSDPDFCVMMFSPATPQKTYEVILRALSQLPRRAAIAQMPPKLSVPKQELSIRQALLSPSRSVGIRQAIGKILADTNLSCPPAIPIGVCGERIDENMFHLFQYYGIQAVRIIP